MSKIKVCYGCGIEVDHALVECPICERTLTYYPVVADPPPPVEPEDPPSPEKGPDDVEEPEA